MQLKKLKKRLNRSQFELRKYKLKIKLPKNQAEEKDILRVKFTPNEKKELADIFNIHDYRVLS